MSCADLIPELVLTVAEFLEDIDLIQFALTRWRFLEILMRSVIKILDKSYDLVTILGNRYPRYRTRLARLIQIRFAERYHIEGRRSLIHIAAQNGDTDIVSMILRRRPKHVTKSDSWGLTPLHLASANGMTDTVCTLLSSLDLQGINAKDCDGNSALHLAAKFNNLECMDMILEGGADVNLVDAFGRTALMLSAERNFKTTCLLLQRGASVTQRDATEATALHHAVSCRIPISRIIKLLLNYHADPLASPSSRRTPFYDAIARNRSEAVGTILDAVSDINTPDHNSENVLHFAAARANDDVISLLLKHGADPTVVSDLNQIPLHFANGRKKIMAFLIRTGKLDIATRDVFGNTAFEAPSPMSLSDTFDTLRLGGLDNTQALEFLVTIQHFRREMKARGLRRSKRRKLRP